MNAQWKRRDYKGVIVTWLRPEISMTQRSLAAVAAVAAVAGVAAVAAAVRLRIEGSEDRLWVGILPVAEPISATCCTYDAIDVDGSGTAL